METKEERASADKMYGDKVKTEETWLGFMPRERKCIGFGEFKGKCPNIAGTKWSPYWCERCNKLRLDHIDHSLKEITKRFEEKADGKPVKLFDV